MKKFLSVLLMVAGLMSCGDDDKPFIPELNKLTSVTCTKNGNAFFNANITYDQDKQINRIILTYIIHSGFISGYQNRYGDNLKPPTNVYHRMTA